MNETELLRCGLRAAYALVADEPFETGLAEALRSIVGTDCAAVIMCRDWRHQTARLTMAGEPTELPAHELDAWQRRFAEHPYFANLLATGDPRPYRTSEFMSFRRFRQTPVYRELLAQYGLRHQLVMTLRLTDQDRVFVGLLRGLRDFSDREANALEQPRAVLSTALAYQAEVHEIQARIRPALLPGDHGQPRLTVREDEVLALVAVGHTNDQVARRLGVSNRTVRKHLEAVFGKAHVPSRSAAVAWWLRRPG
jgi:DNA-binding CsgD family transcriptional regulator